MPVYINLPQASLGTAMVAVGALAARDIAGHFALPRWAVRAVTLGVGGWLACSLDLGLPPEIMNSSHTPAAVWSRAVALLWVGISAGIAIWLRCRSAAGEFDPSRRRLMQSAGAVAVSAPLAATGYGMYIAQRAPRLTEIDVAVAGLHPDLHGLRMVQISDIHLSPFFSRTDLVRAVDLANETKAQIALVTGDLISSAADPLDECLAELRRLRADAPTLGCLGNHEVYARAENYCAAKGRAAGIDFLRTEARQLRFGRGVLNMAGVDYQRKGLPYLPGAEKLVRPGMTNVLLSHNPDVLPVAARQGYDVMLSGHTHGGQVTVEILHQSISPARFYTPFVRGLYRVGNTAGFVTSGLGTVGAPVRISAEPEIALIRLVNA